MRRILGVVVAVVAMYFARMVVRGGMEAAGFILSSSLEKELKAGVAEVEPDVDAFVSAWAKKSSPERKRAAAAAIMWYGTEEEVRSVFVQRSSLFLEIANDGSKNVACSGGEAPASVFEPASRFAPYARIMGRALAHDFRDDTIWAPKVNFDDQKHWAELGDYLRHSGGNTVWQDLMAGVGASAPDSKASKSSGGGSPRTHMCKAMAEIYRMAVARGNDDIGCVPLFDFVRSLDLWAAENVGKK